MGEENEQDEHRAELEDVIKVYLTPAFLAYLRIVAKTYGWQGDYLEVMHFVQWCFGVAGEEIPTYEELEPYK